MGNGCHPQATYFRENAGQVRTTGGRLPWVSSSAVRTSRGNPSVTASSMAARTLDGVNCNTLKRPSVGVKRGGTVGGTEARAGQLTYCICCPNTTSRYAGVP